MKKTLQNRLAKWKRILTLAQTLCDEAVAREDAPTSMGEIKVTGIIAQNCDIKVGKQTVPVTQERHGVLIRGTPDERGNFLQQLVNTAKKAS